MADEPEIEIDETDVEIEEECELEDAFYDEDDEPTLACLCGEEFSAPTWAEAGALFDAHLASESETEEP